jgi:acyl carrier protein
MTPTAEDVREALSARLSFVHGELSADRELSVLRLDSLDKLELLMVIDELYAVRLSSDDFQNLVTVGQLTQLIARRAAEVNP